MLFTEGVNAYYEPYVPALWLRALLIFAAAGLSCLVVASLRATPLGVLPLLALLVLLGAYQRWLQRRERELRAVLTALAAPRERADAPAVVAALWGVVGAARVHLPHLAAQALEQIAETHWRSLP